MFSFQLNSTEKDITEWELQVTPNNRKTRRWWEKFIIIRRLPAVWSISIGRSFHSQQHSIQGVICNWYVSNWRLDVTLIFLWGGASLELAQGPSRVALAWHSAGSSTPFGVTMSIFQTAMACLSLSNGSNTPPHWKWLCWPHRTGMKNLQCIPGITAFTS